MSRQQQVFDAALLRTSAIDAVKKLDPRVQFRNPVMFVVYLGSLLTTVLAVLMSTGYQTGSASFTGAVSVWLWFTVLFANMAEALAEGRSKAQANSLKGVKKPALRKNCRLRITEQNGSRLRPMSCAKGMRY